MGSFRCVVDGGLDLPIPTATATVRLTGGVHLLRFVVQIRDHVEHEVANQTVA